MVPIFLRLFLFFLLVSIVSCSPKRREELIIFHASTFSRAINDLVNEFKKIHPQIKVITESSGSREACFKVSQLKRRADILALADYLVIEDLLMPEYADWFIKFAGNQMVICFTEHSKYGDEINKDNWYEILSRPEVKIGRINPDLAPLGYRTLMLWQLADIYYQEKIDGKCIYEALYQNCPPTQVRHEEVELLPLLQNLALDYVFQYLSIAKQHNLKYITLPKEINLSCPDFDSFYRQAKVTLTGKKKGEFSTVYGCSIAYAVTIPKDSLNYRAALEFLKFLLGEEGKKIIQRNHFEVLSKAIASDISKIPQELRVFCQ